MATPESLIQKGLLVKFEAKLDPGQMEKRLVYITKDAHEWCYSSRELGRSSCPNPASYDLVYAALSDFVSGCLLYLGADVRRLKPETDDIWEIKTQPPDAVRVFGWFYRANSLIVSHCAYRKDLGNWAAYGPQIARVKRLRKKLGCVRANDFKWGKDETTYFDL